MLENEVEKTKIGGNLSAPKGVFGSPPKPLPTHELILLSSAQSDEENTLRPIYSAVADRVIINPPKFNPAICDSLGFKRVRKRTISPKTPIVWELPGHDKFGNGCGTIRAVNVCEKLDTFSAIKRHCWRFGCPTCWWDTATRKTAEIVERLDAVDGLAVMYPTLCWQHVVVSPPQSLAKKLVSSVEGFTNMRTTAIQIVRELGGVAGVCVFHPYRENGEDDYNNRIETQNDGTHGHWRTAPHFHFLVLGFFRPDDVKTLYKGWKWVLKSIHAHLSKDARVGTLNYLLTHVGVGSVVGRRNIQAYQYFGDATPSKTRIIADLEQYSMPRCKNCGGAIFTQEISSQSFYPTSSQPFIKVEKGGLYVRAEYYNETRKLLENITTSQLPAILRNHPELHATIKQPDLFRLRDSARIRRKSDEGTAAANWKFAAAVRPFNNPLTAEWAQNTLDSIQTRPFSRKPPHRGGVCVGNMGVALSSFASPPAGGGRGRKGGDIPPPTR